MQKIEITGPGSLDQSAPYTMALVAAATYSKQELDKRQGLNPLIDGIASPYPAIVLEEMFVKARLGIFDIAVWSGVQPNSIGILRATPDVQVYEVDETGNPDSQVQKFDGVLLEAFVHVDKNEPSLADDTNALKFDVINSLVQVALAPIKEMYSDVAILERSQPPTGVASYIGGRKISSLFKRESSFQNPMEKALAVSSFLLKSQHHGFHFRSDFEQYRPSYSGLYLLDVDN